MHAKVADLVVVRAKDETRATLAAWNERPWPVLRTWVFWSVVVALGLLGVTWIVATLTPPDPTPLAFPGLTRPPALADVGLILAGNSLVLALHAFACVAGFIAGSSLPLSAERYSGVWRWIHDAAGPIAIAWVTACTLFSLATQAYVLGAFASTLAAQGDISPGLLLLGFLPHALPELAALFLPLAAWVIASRRGEWNQLLAATIVTVTIAIPVLVASAFFEVYVSPDILRALAEHR